LSTSVTVVEAVPSSRTNRSKNSSRQSGVSRWRTTVPRASRWGYGGSGPAQLALALLLDYTEDEALALDYYQEFKTEVVSQLDCTGSDGCWRLTGSDIDAVLRDPSEEPVAPSI